MHSRITVLGHPVHPMLIAYPLALYTITFISYLIYAYVSTDSVWVKVAIAANGDRVGVRMPPEQPPTAPSGAGTV
jgi:hypothetical protein